MPRPVRNVPALPAGFQARRRQTELRRPAFILRTFCKLHPDIHPAFFRSVSRDPAGASIERLLLSCRPVLYGICLWGIFSIERKEPSKDKDIPEKVPTQTPIQEQTEKRTCMTATETFEAYRKLGLTNREAELSILIEQGFRNAEIAAELNISETTVKKHIANIFEKLEVSKREQIKEKLF